MNASDFDLELQRLYEKSVGQLLGDYFDARAFDAFYEYLCEKAELIKEEHVVSKQVISYLLSASQTIGSRQEYLPVVRQHQELAAKFEMLLGLIAIGEGVNDRKSGVPRIV